MLMIMDALFEPAIPYIYEEIIPYPRYTGDETTISKETLVS